MYAASGAQVAIEFRLFGQTLRTGFVPASPPITLMDSHHQMHIRARQSALRRYFFASPRIFVAIMYSHADAIDQQRDSISRRAAMIRGSHSRSVDGAQYKGDGEEFSSDETSSNGSEDEAAGGEDGKHPTVAWRTWLPQCL
jgi:hypothetical protein